MGVIVHMIKSGMSACDPHREKRPRLCAWAGRVSTAPPSADTTRECGNRSHECFVATYCLGRRKRWRPLDLQDLVGVVAIVDALKDNPFPAVERSEPRVGLLRFHVDLQQPALHYRVRLAASWKSCAVYQKRCLRQLRTGYAAPLLQLGGSLPPRSNSHKD